MEPLFFQSVDTLIQHLRASTGQRGYWIVDATCYNLYSHELKSIDLSHIYIYPASEQNKNVDYYMSAMQFLSNQNVQRDSVIINLGGGITTDFGGFVAATYRRGIPCINVPTTLMGMTDAALGGKTGINFQHLKNMIGTFSTPTHIYICSAFLKTLPQQELRSGFAEMLKHGLINDAHLWEDISTLELSTLSLSDWDGLIKRSTNVKRTIVQKDFTESGIRKALNFGHTIGHAIESYALSKELPLTHGEAVVIGMIAEAYISQRVAGLSEQHLSEICRKLDSLYDHRPEFSSGIDAISTFIKYDKKGLNNQVGFTLLKSIGSYAIDVPVDAPTVIDALNYYFDQSWK